MSYKSDCCNIQMPENITCDCNCNHSIPTIEKLWVRKIDEQWQVKLTEDGEWINAEYDEVTQIIRFLE